MMSCDHSTRTPRLRKCILFFLICGFKLLLLKVWLGNFHAWSDTNPAVVSTRISAKNVTILLWHWPFGTALSLKDDVCWNLYNITGCRLTSQRSEFWNAEVVVFHNRELMGKETLPLNLFRPVSQKWAWMSLEAPENNGNLKPFANLFNLTVSYRRDADISIPYGELQPQDQKVKDYPINKSHLVCWVVSNYRSAHKRSQVFQQLKAIVPVKVYGRWNKTPLRTADLVPTISQCYFYLAFENSLSKDYITEKLWKNAYQAGAVPIVLGASREDYKEVAAPDSFIHVDQFASVKELARYVQELAADRKHYEEYFKWKLKWRVKLYTDWRERLCKICTQYDRLPQWKVYSDLDGWNKKNSYI